MIEHRRFQNFHFSTTLNLLKIESRKFTAEFYRKGDSERVIKIDLKSSDEIKLDRKQLWSQREGFIGTVEQKEGLVYGVEDF